MSGTHVRSDFFATMVLADAHLRAGDPEEACRVALDALDLGEQLKSPAASATSPSSGSVWHVSAPRPSSVTSTTRRRTTGCGRLPTESRPRRGSVGAAFTQVPNKGTAG